MRHLGQERSVPPDTSGSASSALARHPGSPARPKRRSPIPLRKCLIRVELSHRLRLARLIVRVNRLSPSLQWRFVLLKPRPEFSTIRYNLTLQTSIDQISPSSHSISHVTDWPPINLHASANNKRHYTHYVSKGYTKFSSLKRDGAASLLL